MSWKDFRWGGNTQTLQFSWAKSNNFWDIKWATTTEYNGNSASYCQLLRQKSLYFLNVPSIYSSEIFIYTYALNNFCSLQYNFFFFFFRFLRSDSLREIYNTSPVLLHTFGIYSGWSKISPLSLSLSLSLYIYVCVCVCVCVCVWVC